MHTKDKAYLEHIAEAITKIEKYLRHATLQEIKTNEMLQDAVVRELEILGEASNNISEEFRKKHPDITWHEIIGMRNKLIHEYFGVDLDILWKTYQEDLPLLKSKIKEIRMY